MSCKYCDGSKNQAYLIDDKGSDMYVDRDTKRLCFEHVEVYNRGKGIGSYTDPYDCDEDVLYKEAVISFCPKCGSKL
jgi:hypothetical protein